MVRVLMVSADELFGRGVEAVMRREPELEVVGYEADVESAVEFIHRLRPEAVVMVRPSHSAPDAWRWVARLLEEGVRRVIILSSRDNTMYIRGRHERIPRRPEDLMKAIGES